MKRFLIGFSMLVGLVFTLCPEAWAAPVTIDTVDALIEALANPAINDIVYDQMYGPLSIDNAMTVQSGVRLTIKDQTNVNVNGHFIIESGGEVSVENSCFNYGSLSISGTLAVNGKSLSNLTSLVEVAATGNLVIATDEAEFFGPAQLINNGTIQTRSITRLSFYDSSKLVNSGTFQNHGILRFYDDSTLSTISAIQGIAYDAKIGQTPYLKLSDAVAAARPGDVIKMLQDVEATWSVTIKSGITLDVGSNRLVFSEHYMVIERGATMVLGKGGFLDSSDGSSCEGTVIGAGARKDHAFSMGFYSILTDGLEHAARNSTIVMLSDAQIGPDPQWRGVPEYATLEVGNHTLTTTGTFSIDEYATLRVGAGGKVIIEDGRFSIDEYAKMYVDGLLRNNSVLALDGTLWINGSYERSADSVQLYSDLFLRVTFDPTQIEPIDGVRNIQIGEDTGMAQGYVRYGQYVELEAKSEHFTSWALSDSFKFVECVPTDRAVGVQFINTCNIKLVTDEPPLVVTPETLALKVGESGLVTASEDAVAWSSSKEAVATVSSTGQVRAVAQGKTVVTATAKDGRTASCAVTVTEEPGGPEAPKPIDIGINVLTVAKGNELILPVFKDVVGTWTVTDASIAAITRSGKRVKALEPGSTKLRYTVERVPKRALVIVDRTLKEGDIYEIELKVRKKSELVTQVTLDAKRLTLATEGSTTTAQLVANVKPGTALDKEIFWTSTNPAVATVDKNGLVTAVGVGKCKVIAVATNLKRKAVDVTVTGAIAVKPAKKTIKAGKTFELIATITAALEDKTVTWSSSDTAVATVDALGKVTTLKKGKVTITAVASNGETAICTVTVKKG